MNYKEVIESRYNRHSWQMLLHDIFGNKVDFPGYTPEVSVDKTMAKSAFYIGKITLPDGHIIAIYEVELSDSVIIERNRASIRNLLCTNWRSMGCAGAFMFCYRQNEAVLRFSYVSESFAFAEDGSLTKESTDTKRFTYLLGEGHHSRTAIQQFEELKASKQDLKAITKAFSVEALSDMFFKEYKKNYEDIIEFITGKRMVKVANKWEERVIGDPCREIMAEFDIFPDAEKAVRDYVKKLMGRLVFIQFLQKKGWMGCSAGKAWNDGDKEFVQTLFANSPYKGTFVDDVLEPLFDDINTKREGDLVSDARVGTGIKVPYLNGGLFEHDKYDKARFPLPAKYMKQMLDFFASYNFTIDENDPDDAEIGVDPEMLGRIFENLLEDNKDKGAFYTPKEIVQYMCRESLIAYLQTDIEEDTTKDAIRQFVTTYNADMLSSELAATVDQKLKDVKICDPAIGSGAFPMGLLRELFACRRAIEGLSDEKAVEIKTHIIQQNIYGVDIEKGAVDIARLRFWLALIVDEKTPHALPNMDFKIMQGNSLLEQYNGFDLSKIMSSKKKVEGPVQMTFFEDDVDLLRHQLIDLRRSYYTATDKEKKKSICKSMRELVQQQIQTLSYNIDLSGIDIAETSEFFLWHTWFADVFEQGGFDIVIGNPPYVQLQTEGGKLGDLYKSLGYKTFAKTGDIYCLFYEQGYNLLRERGHLCYITSNKWMRAGYGEKTRGFFAEKTNPCLLIDFAGVKIFESATVNTNILLFEKAKNTLSTKCVVTTKDAKNCLNNLSDYVQSHYGTQSLSDSNTWTILSSLELSIKKKIESVGRPLRDWDINIYRGILTGYNEAFIITTEKRNDILSNCATDEERRRTDEIIRPILRGRDIKRYSHDWANLWLLWIPWHFPLHLDSTIQGASEVAENEFKKQYPAIYKHLLHYKPELSARNKAETGIRYEWYAMQRWGANYWEDFDKPKAMWKIIGCNINFAFDDNKMVCNNAVDIITGDRNILLQFVGIMNSKLFDWYLKLTTEAEVQGGGIQLYVTTLEKTLVKLDFSNGLGECVENRVAGKATDEDVDKYVFEAYGLTEDEINYILNCKAVNRQ